MSDVNKNDVLGNLFGGSGGIGGIFKGKNSILILLLLFFLLNQSGIWCKFDENLILVFVVVILLFGGSFKF